MNIRKRIKIFFIIFSFFVVLLFCAYHILLFSTGIKTTSRIEKAVLKNNKVEYVTKEVVNVVEKSNSVKPVKEEKQVDDTNGEWIKAPFVGTFYAAPSANEAPYVKVGQKIKEGDIIE